MVWGVSLPTCRHSQVLDCGEDSLRAKQAGKCVTGQLKRPRCLTPEPDAEMCSRCGGDTKPTDQVSQSVSQSVSSYLVGSQSK